MKSLVKFFLGILFLILLCSCSKPDPNVTVSWTVPPGFLDGSQFPSDSELRYELFIDIDQDNTHEDKIPLTKQPIKETNFTTTEIEKLAKGHYYLGVRAVLFKNGKPVNPSQPSEINWSSNKTGTNPKPFGVYIK